jgi:hypothetical protein
MSRLRWLGSCEIATADDSAPQLVACATAKEPYLEMGAMPAIATLRIVCEVDQVVFPRRTNTIRSLLNVSLNRGVLVLTNNIRLLATSNWQILHIVDRPVDFDV